VRAGFDITDKCPSRNILERKRIPVLYFNIRPPRNRITNTDSLGNEHVFLPAIIQSDKCNGGVPGRIMFNADN